MERPRISVIIPVFNEEASLPLVVGDIPRAWVDEIVVVDNGSTDRTPLVANGLDVTLVREPVRGYGSACLRGITHLAARHPDREEIVVFLDGDYSDHPEELPDLVRPIVEEGFDFVIGSRMRGERERGAMLPQARIGNHLALFLIRLFFHFRYTDLGPFRAIRWGALETLQMADPDFGWTIEMQIKALRHGLAITEVPVRYRRRVGVSKITGTVSGTLRAGYKILSTIFRHALLEAKGNASQTRDI